MSEDAISRLILTKVYELCGLKKKLRRCVKNDLYLRQLCETYVIQEDGYFMTGVSELSVAELRHYKDFFHMSAQ